MNKEKVKRASELLEEINDLSMYKKLLNDREFGKVTHVNFVAHYGNTDGQDNEKVIFHHKYNNKFIPVFESIILELEKELDAI